MARRAPAYPRKPRPRSRLPMIDLRAVDVAEGDMDKAARIHNRVSHDNYINSLVAAHAARMAEWQADCMAIKAAAWAAGTPDAYALPSPPRKPNSLRLYDAGLMA